MIIGTIHNSLRMAKLEMKWQQRKANPTRPREGEEENPQLRQMREELERSRERQVMMGIEGKLRSGADLSQEEMEYLKQNHPQLYQEAVELRLERQAYRRQLRNCRTQEEVDRLHNSRLQQFASQAKAISQNPNLSTGEKKGQLEKIFRRMMGIRREHTKFIKSGNYQRLPTEEELQNKRAAREKRTRPCHSPPEEELLHQTQNPAPLPDLSSPDAAPGASHTGPQQDQAANRTANKAASPPLTYSPRGEVSPQPSPETPAEPAFSRKG